MRRLPRDLPALMTPGEVGAAFSVSPKTVARWARAGKLRCIRTLGGDRRYYRCDIEALLQPDLPAGVL